MPEACVPGMTTKVPTVVAQRAHVGSMHHVKVKCPYCGELHGHGYGTGKNGTCTADCGGGEYYVVFEPQ